MTSKKILIPMPSKGVDPSELAIPWKLFSEKGFEIVFTTPNGQKAKADPIMVTGEGLGLLKSLLAARKDAVDAYRDLEVISSFRNPIKYENVIADEYDAIFLPGGHDKSVKEYLESKILQNIVVSFFKAKKPVGAVCHGVLVAARALDPDTGKSIISDYKTTCLLKSQELMGYNLTRLWMKDYYLTYPEITVEDEVKGVLSNAKNLIQGPLPVLRDDAKHLSRGFIVRDRNYVSGRWPGDLYNLSAMFIKMVDET